MRYDPKTKIRMLKILFVISSQFDSSYDGQYNYQTRNVMTICKCIDHNSLKILKFDTAKKSKNKIV